MRVKIPYGNEMVECNVPNEAYIGTIDPPKAIAAKDPVEVIRTAIENPIGMGKLESILSPEKTVAIVTDDGSRPTPINLVLPVLLEKIKRVGIPKENIIIIMALGSHRYMTTEEMEERVGKEIFREYTVINSEFHYPDRLVKVGETEEGTPILVTKEVAEADIRIGVGNLVPHPVMGWGGGGKIIFPGVAGEDTVSYFHLKASLFEENMFGKSTTPIRDMMENWMKFISLDFIINTILTQDLELCQAVAGDYIKAHREGVEIGKRTLGSRITEKADVVIVSSHPADQDFWQSPKAMYGAEPALKGDTGGTMILVSPNFEGIGPHREYPEYMGKDDGDEIVKKYIENTVFQTSRHKDESDRLAIAVGNSMSKMRRRRKLVVVGDGVTKEDMEHCGCLWYPLSKFQQAIDEAVQEYENCRISVLSAGAETFLYEEGTV